MSRYYVAVLVLSLLVVTFAVVFGYMSAAPWVGVNDPDTRTFRTLWDWMELLIVPAVLALAALWISDSQKRRDLTRATLERQTELQVTLENQRDQALQKYLDNMSDLILTQGIKTGESEQALAIASARSLAILRLLDPERKGVVLRFLIETQLINEYDTKLQEHIMPPMSLEGADLTGAKLSHAWLGGVVLHRPDFTGAELSRAILMNAVITRGNFSRADLSRSELIDARISHSRLQGASLKYTNASDVDFSFSDLTGADFSGSLLHQAQFREATLRGVSFADCVMRGASFKGADLSAADLSSADLSPWVDGTATSMEGADLSGAQLEGADLTGVNFKGAIVSHIQLSNAKTHEGAILPAP